MQIKRNVLLNPGPATTTDSVKLAQIVSDICPREQEFGEVMQDVADGMLRIVHASPDEYSAVLFAGSGTLAMDVCVNSLLPEGKKILIINNGSYSARAVEIAKAYGLAYSDLHLPTDCSVDLAKVANALEEDSEIAVVYATHQETGTGVLNPIKEIGALSHAYGAIFVCDTTSTLALMPIDMKRDNLDFCMTSAQKGIQGMAGLAFVIGRTSLIEATSHYPCRSYYCNLFLQYDYFRKTRQMQFTPPVQVLYAARQAIREYFEEGEQAKWQRHQCIMKAIHIGLRELGFCEAILPKYQAGLVATVRYPSDKNWNFNAVHDYCYERGFTIYPGKMQKEKTFRLCALGAIEEEDIQAFFTVLRGALTELNISVPVSYKEIMDHDAGTK